MATLQDAAYRIDVREGQGDLALKLTLERDFSGTVLAVYLTDRRGATHTIGEATGVGKGDDMLIAVTFDVPPARVYSLEVGPKDESLPPIFPEQDEQAEVFVHDALYNNN